MLIPDGLAQHRANAVIEPVANYVTLNKEVMKSNCDECSGAANSFVCVVCVQYRVATEVSLYELSRLISMSGDVEAVFRKVAVGMGIKSAHNSFFRCVLRTEPIAVRLVA